MRAAESVALGNGHMLDYGSFGGASIFAGGVMRFTRLLFLIAVCSCSAFGQSTPPVELNVGDPQIHTDSLKPYTNSWRLTVSNEAGKQLEETAIWTDELKETTASGKPCLE